MIVLPKIYTRNTRIDPSMLRTFRHYHFNTDQTHKIPNPFPSTQGIGRNIVAVFWDLDNKPPKSVSPFDAAIRLKKAAESLGIVRYKIAYANQRSFDYIPPKVKLHRKDRKTLNQLENKGITKPIDPYICRVCGRKFYTYEKLINHFKQIHEREHAKRVSQIESSKGSQRVKLVGKYSMKMEKYSNAARDILTPKVGYGLGDELKRAFCFLYLRITEKMEKLLYEASLDGNSTALLILLQEDPLILDRVTLHNNDDMPLHVASMLGHIEFVKEIVIRKPHLAMEPDSQRRLPLHIASAKGHVEVVKALVSASPETCLARDRDGRNPLHLAAIKGRYDVVKELVQAHPHAARAMVQQETILHLCVKRNQLEILKFLAERGDHEFVNSKDADGNNILHLAVADKQIETINLLLLDTTIEVNATNTNGDTPMDILAQGPRDVKDKQIIQSLTRAGAFELKTEGFLGEVPQKFRIKMELDNSKYNKKPSLRSHLKIKDSNNDDDWLDKKRNTLMVVASLIATMAFQAGTNPPSGVWQDGSTTDPNRRAGYAVMVYNHPNLYHVFLVCNTVGFVSTLSIILLLISGLPFLKHRVFLWILMVIMWIATSSMSITYWVSISVLTPKPEARTFRNVVNGIVLVWIGLMSLLVMGHSFQLMNFFSKQTYRRKKGPIVINNAEI